MKYNTLKLLCLTCILAGCSGQSLTPESSARVSPFLDPQDFSFYGLRFGETPRQGMYSITPDNALPGTAVYRMTGDPIENQFLALKNPTLQYEYYNNRLFRIVASINDEQCQSFFGLAFKLNNYKTQLKSLYKSLKVYEVRGLREMESIETAEQTALSYINELQEADIKWGYLFEPATIKKDTHDILNNPLLKGDVANSMMPGFILLEYELLVAHYRYIQDSNDYKRLKASTNNYTSPYYMNKSTHVEFKCGDQQSIVFSHNVTAKNLKAQQRDEDFGQLNF